MLKSHRNRLPNKTWYGYLFVAPFFIVFAIFGLYPILYTFFLSFQKWDGLAPMQSMGLGNFTRLINDRVFYQTIGNTLRIWVVNFIPQILTALVLSAIFTFNKVRGMKFFRAAFYLPNLITAASVGLLFSLLFNGDKSLVNHLLTTIGVADAPYDFFNNATFTSSLVSYIQWWMWFGYTTVILMAGITTIDPSIYDATMVDGATKWQTYHAVTLPLIRPTLIYMTITSVIGGMQLFDVPATLTNGQGNPRKAILTTAMYLYNQGFRNHNYGYASAVSIGLFAVIGVLIVFAFYAMHKKEDNL